MSKMVLEIDLADRFGEAKMYCRENPTLPLSQLLRTYPAKFLPGQAPTDNDLARPLSNFLLRPVEVVGDGQVFESEPVDRSLREELDRLWTENGQAVSGPSPVDLDHFKETINDNDAVREAYRHEMDAISDFLRHGLSVLVVCDKVLTEFIFEYVCHRAGKKVRLDSEVAEGPPASLAGSTAAALQGRSANNFDQLPALINNLKPDEILVLRSLDRLDNPDLIEVLYKHTAKGERPQFLGFIDPSLEVKKVLSDRFAVRISILGLPRYVVVPGGKQVYSVNLLLTREERGLFRQYDPENLYKNVAGLNAIQFRQAMKYVGAKMIAGADPGDIYRIIRLFKTSSSDEIEIPDTTFEDIGGYEFIKQQLMRTIKLIAGPVEGLAEKNRGRLIPRGFVFHGPPGTGKTLFAKAIANELNATIQMISGPEIMDKYVGQSENNLRRIFATARRNAPAVVFFDEFDSIAGQRSTYSDGGSRANNAVVAQFLTELDGFRQDQTVLVIGTTNRIDIIDEALLRPSRLRPIEIGLPDYAARKHVARIHAGSFGLDALLKDLFILTVKHLRTWTAARSLDDLPQAFLIELFQKQSNLEKRFRIEERRAGLLRDLHQFFRFVHDNQARSSGLASSGLLDEIKTRLIKLGREYGLDFDRSDLPDLDSPEANDWLMPLKADIKDLFTLLEQPPEQADGLSADNYYEAILDLLAEYTTNFNNDEIRAIFQEAGLEHHLEGQLITPRYLGRKIGLIRRRRDERKAIHLSTSRGR